MNKLVILAVVLVCINLVSAVEESGGTIIGDSVVYDSVYATLTVTPHTAYSPVGDFRQSFTVDSKFSGDLCTAYVFNSPLQHRGISLEQTTSYSVSVDDWGDVERSMMVYNASSIDVTSSPCEVGSGTNTHQRIITQNTLNGSIQTVYCFNSHTQVDDSTYSIIYNDHDVTGSHLEIRYRMQFNSVNSYFSHHNIFSKNVYIQHTPLHFNAYTSHTWEIDYKPQNLAYGKYDLWLWNSLTGDCIADLNNGDYTFRYKLDPWWNNSWSYKLNISISNIAEDITNYPVQIVQNFSTEYSNGKISITCKDIRFTYYNSTADSETKIPYWIEICNFSSDNNMTAWINVTYLENNTNTTIYMYYGNSGANSESNGVDTFSGFDEFDSDNWVDTGSLMYVDTTNGYLYGKGDRSATDHHSAKLVDGVSGDFNFTFNINITTGDSFGPGGTLMIGLGSADESVTTVDNFIGSFIYHAQNTAKIYHYAHIRDADSASSQDAVILGYAFPINISLDINRVGNDITVGVYTIDGVLLTSHTFTSTSLGALNYFVASNNNDGLADGGSKWIEINSDNWIYRKCVSPEPVYSVGAEESSITPPVCSCTQSPADLNFSFLETNVTWYCNCSGDKLNHSSFMWLHSLESYGSVNWSFRPPVNIMSDVERRACNRYNKSVYPEYASWYEYISNLPQFTGNIYEWGVHDYLSAKVTLVASGSNWSNYSTTAFFEHLFSSEWDLNRIFLQSEDKSSQYKSIYTDHLGAKKFTKGSTRVNATYSCHINLESQNSLKYTSVHYCNESLVLLHEPDPASKDYCHFIDSFMVSNYAYSIRNSSYVGNFQFKVNDSGFINGIEAGSTYYILVSLKENTFSKATRWHYADTPNITGDGVGFDNINRSFYSVDNGDSWVTGNYSFDIVCRYAHPDNDTLKWFVYLCNNDSVCWNSSVTTDILGQFENSPPNVQILSPVVDEIISGLHNITWTANDPDSDPMSFSGVLYHSNGSYNSTLFTNLSGYFFSWNSSQVDDDYWSINVTASDPYSNSSSSSGLFIVDNIPGFDIHFWTFDVSGSPISNVNLNVRNSSNSSLWSNLTNSGGFALYSSADLVAHYIYVVYPSPGYSAVLSNVSGDSVVNINDWVSGRVRLSNTLGALLEDQDCSVVVYESTSSVLVHDYATQCHAGSSFVNRHGDWVSISNCSLTDSGGWYFFKGRVDESMGFEYDKNYDLVFTCNGESANFSFITSFEKTPLDMRKTEDFIRNYGGLFIIYGFFGFLCLLVLIIIIFVLLMRKS